MQSDAPAAALPGAEAGTPDGEEVRRIVRDALRRPLSSTEAAYLNRLAALTSEVVTGNAALVTAEGELVELEAENARLTSEVRALTEAGGFILRHWLERDGMAESRGLHFTYTNDDDLAVWDAATFGQASEALEVFPEQDAEAQAFAWFAARLASPSPTGAT